MGGSWREGEDHLCFWWAKGGGQEVPRGVGPNQSLFCALGPLVAPTCEIRRSLERQEDCVGDNGEIGPWVCKPALRQSPGSWAGFCPQPQFSPWSVWVSGTFPGWQGRAWLGLPCVSAVRVFRCLLCHPTCVFLLCLGLSSAGPGPGQLLKGQCPVCPSHIPASRVSWRR